MIKTREIVAMLVMLGLLVISVLTLKAENKHLTAAAAADKKIKKLLTPQRRTAALKHYMEGRKAIDQNNFRQGIRLMSKSLSYNPLLTDALRDRGQCYMKQKDYKKAVSDFTEIQQLFSADSSIYLLRGSAFAKLDKWVEAEKDFGVYTVFRPMYDTAYINRAVCLLQLGKSDEALFQLSKALFIDSKSNIALLTKADILSQQGRYNEAVPCYQTVSNLYSLDAETCLDYGYALYITQNFKLAIDVLGKVLQQNPKNAEAYSIRGKCFYELRVNIKACDDFLKAQQNGDKEAAKILERYCVKQRS